jgi:hypothetical protein
MGLLQSTATTSSAISIGMSILAAAWNNATIGLPANANTNLWGQGSTSSSNSSAPATINPSALSPMTVHMRPWFMIRNGGS